MNTSSQVVPILSLCAISPLTAIDDSMLQLRIPPQTPLSNTPVVLIPSCPLVSTMNNITSTVGVSSRPTHTQQRSSTVTAIGTNLRKKDKGRERDTTFGLHEDVSVANTNTIKKKKSLLSKPHVSLTFPDLSPLDTENYDLAQALTAVPSDRRPPQSPIL
jgi:hypothetical protein